MHATAAANPSLRRTRLFDVLARRWPTGLAVAATIASLALVSALPGRVQTWISAWGVLTAAVIYLTWGTARGDLGARRWLTAQTTAVLAFAAVAIAPAAAYPRHALIHARSFHQRTGGVLDG